MKISVTDTDYGGEGDYDSYVLSEFETKQEAEQELEKLKKLLGVRK